MSGRLLRIEFRRNATWVLLPLLAALLWIASPYGRGLRAPVALWSSRSLALQGSIQVIGPFAAGMAAWMASRETRRGLRDVLGSTATGWWSRRLATLAATAAWSLTLYLAAGVVLFGLTAGQATWGGPVWWPVSVGGVGVLACTAVGFTFGVALPSRFTAPLVAIGLLLALQLTLALRGDYLLVSPARDSLSTSASVFFGVDPGLAITQLIFGCGVTAAAVAAVAWPIGPGRLRTPGPPTAIAAVSLATAGVAAIAASLLLAGTARQDTPQGTVIPALHAAVSARPVSYTPVCDDRPPIPVCAHPAYRSILPAVAADLAPVTAQVAGLPGAPTQIELADPGSPPPASKRQVQVFAAELINTQGPMTSGEIAISIRYGAAEAITGAASADWPGVAGGPAQAQFAVALGLQLAAGARHDLSALPAPLATAAHRFAALPGTARRAWLAGHLAGLRAGRVTLAEVP